MRLISYILIATLYATSFALRYEHGKKLPLTFQISASVMLILNGFFLNENVFLICSCWALTDILFDLYLLYFKKKIKYIIIIAIQLLYFIACLYTGIKI